MASAAKGDTVWIGFMDIVPVIGTVKEAVELVLALYEGDKAMISKKEKAFENIVKESLKKHVKSTPAAAPAAAADEYSGLRNVKEVRKEKIIEHMQKGGKRGTKPTAADEQKARQRKDKVENIKKRMLEKIEILNTDYHPDLTIELEKRSGRGEHVFNNNILKFHSGVVRTFTENKGFINMRGYDQIKRDVDALGNHTLPPKTARDIGTNMVVDFEEDEFYVNVNAVVYGVYCRELRAALLAVLRNINPHDVPEEEKQRVNFIIDNMNDLEIYVDEYAKIKWIANRARSQDRFNQVKKEVVNMYENERGNDWCLRILGLVAPLFNA